jgi:hypothetical protein
MNTVPLIGSLYVLADLGGHSFDGRRALVTADIDMAQRQTSNESHFKISRLAETVRYLVERNAAVMVLGAQGSTSVRLLEPGNTQSLEWHRRALARSLPAESTVNRFDLMDDALSADLTPGTVTLLPNLAEVSREDDAFASREISDDGPEADRLLCTACEMRCCRRCCATTTTYSSLTISAPPSGRFRQAPGCLLNRILRQRCLLLQAKRRDIRGS